MVSSSSHHVVLLCVVAFFPTGARASAGHLRGANASSAVVDRRLSTFRASTSRFHPGDSAGSQGENAACGGASLNTITSTLSGSTYNGKKYFAIAPSQNMVQPMMCDSADESTGAGSPSKSAGSYASSNILHLHCGRCIEFTSDITGETVGGMVFDTCPATSGNSHWCTKDGAKNDDGYYNHLDFFGSDSDYVTGSIGDNPAGSISLVNCPADLTSAIKTLAAATESSKGPVCNYHYNGKKWQGSPGQDEFGCDECSGGMTVEQPTTTPAATATPTETTTPTAPSCEYAANGNTAVKNQGTGGAKLKRKKFSKTADYLAACKLACNSDSTCGGFVDDPTDNRGRMCKPKKIGSSGYSKSKKTFYTKGSGC